MKDHEQENYAIKAARIRQLNDEFRTTGVGGQIMLTQGVHQMLLLQQVLLMEMIRQYDAFSPANDPHSEHDFGTVTVNREKVFFKIDYYDIDMEYGSPDPADIEVTLRVMTVMLAQEY
jgi:Protein of unknown function (DUF3768)